VVLLHFGTLALQRTSQQNSTILLNSELVNWSTSLLVMSSRHVTMALQSFRIQRIFHYNTTFLLNIELSNSLFLELWDFRAFLNPTPHFFQIPNLRTVLLQSFGTPMLRDFWLQKYLPYNTSKYPNVESTNMAISLARMSKN
jgi:hypothetical protein